MSARLFSYRGRGEGHIDISPPEGYVGAHRYPEHFDHSGLHGDWTTLPPGAVFVYTFYETGMGAMVYRRTDTPAGVTTANYNVVVSLTDDGEISKWTEVLDAR